MTNYDYIGDVSIDESALDVEWLRQPELMLRYSQHAAWRKAEMDKAKEALDVIRAELDKEIRSNPGGFGLNKITESGITNTIITQKSYQEASQRYVDAKYEYEMAAAAVRAIDQKKTALENLVKLHGMSYFAGPKVPRDLSTEWRKKKEQENSNRKIKITRRTT